METSTATARTLNERSIMVGASLLDREIAAGVESHGGRAISWPAPRIEALEDQGALDEAIENLFGYDWIIFLHSHAVEYFFRRYDELASRVSNLDSLRVGAVGTATADHLESRTVHVDIREQDIASLIEAVLKYVDSEQGLSPLNFLVPSAEGSRSSLGAMLEDKGARADIVPTYRTAPRERIGQLAALLAGGAIDCVVFSDAASVEAFAELFDVHDLSQMLGDTKVICGDRASASLCATLQRPPDATAREPKARGLIETIEQSNAD
ncbi:MAG TPA: uroporphyrinogen-III synthase [Pyrinomonadaceae bacterium]|nr:uroporphyrinogen-III synthase [Pyrinomonadaceae bacterium]